MKKPKTDWKRKYEMAWRELQEVMRKYMDAEAELSRRPTIEKFVERQVIHPLVVVAFFVLTSYFAFLVLYGFKEIKRLDKPIRKPYPVYVDKYCPGRWEDKCRRAWKALEHHHSGVNNGRAFAILNEP